MSAKMSVAPSTSAPGAIALCGTRLIRIATPLHRKKRRSSTSRSPDGSSAQSVMSKSSLRLIENSPGVGPPIRKARILPCGSSPRSEIAIRVPASGWPFGTISIASSPLLWGSLATPGGTGIGSARASTPRRPKRSEEHTSELQSHLNLVCRLLLEKKKKTDYKDRSNDLEQQN